jgi:hypothetical protein
MPPMMPQQQMPQGMPQQGGMPLQAMQNPQIQQFMQMLQAMGYAPQANLQNGPQQPQGGPQMPQQGAGAPMPQPMQPGAQGGQSPVQPPMMQHGPMQGQPQPGHQQYTPQELAAMGRLGDNAVAHLTKGEVTVPPQVQSSKVLATINKEMHKKGVDVSQFTVGSPNVSHNPQTGLPEQSFWSALLPILGGIGGTLLAPGIGTELGSTLGASALAGIGGGVGSAVGGLASGESPMQAIGSGALSGLGGYYGGQLLGPSADATSQAASQSANQTGINALPTAAAKEANQALLNQTADQLAAQPSLSNLYGAMPNGSNLGSAGGSLFGGLVGQQLFGSGNSNTSSSLPPGFNKPYTPPGQNPSAQTQLGYNTTKQPQANFTGYNPATNFSNAYNFFPSQSSGG